MISLFTDKEQTLECSIKIEGAYHNKIIPRLIIKPNHSNRSFFVEGKINNGLCNVKIPPLPDINESGDLFLEVIVDNTLFKPWTSTYEIKTEKKLTVENIEVNEVPVNISLSDIKMESKNKKQSIQEKKKPAFSTKKKKKVSEDKLNKLTKNILSDLTKEVKKQINESNDLED